MKILALSVLLACTPALAAPQGCDLGEPHPEAPEELAQFSFLIGHHDVALHSRQPGGWTPPRPVGAAWNGRYALDGRAIYDEWLDPGWGRNPGTSGVNVRVFDPDAALWKMMWIATGAFQVQDLRAEMRDGILTMWQVYPERPGWKAEFREIDASSWERVAYQQDPTTGEWAPQFRLVATRRPCA